MRVATVKAAGALVLFSLYRDFGEDTRSSAAENPTAGGKKAHYS